MLKDHASPPHPSRPGRPGRPAADVTAGRRDQILAQAQRLFSENGVHRVSTREIARAVGISQPSLYAHFKSKQALIDAVAAATYEALAERLQAVVDSDPAETRLERSFRAYIDFAFQNQDAYRAAFMLETNDPTPPEISQSLRAGMRAFDIHCELINAEMPGASGTEVRLEAQSHWASLHGLVSLLIARPVFPWSERQELIDHHVARLLEPFKRRA